MGLPCGRVEVCLDMGKGSVCRLSGGGGRGLGRGGMGRHV